MDLVIQQVGHVTVISVAGSVDALTGPQVEGCLQEQLDHGQRRLVLDLGQVDYMGSVGLRVILSMLERSRKKGGDLRLAGVQHGVMKVLQVSGADCLVTTYATPDEAVGSYRE